MNLNLYKGSFIDEYLIKSRSCHSTYQRCGRQWQQGEIDDVAVINYNKWKEPCMDKHKKYELVSQENNENGKQQNTLLAK